MAPYSDLSVVVFGAGSIGRRHAMNLSSLGVRTTLCSRSARGTLDVGGGRVIQATVDEKGALRKADAVVIATPTDEHMRLAHLAARAGKALYIEKPLSHDATGIAVLRDLAAGLVVEVGCQLRSHPGLRVLKDELHTERYGRILAFRGCVGQRLDAWRPGTDYRASYSSDAARGGGAMFDLVHEIDLVNWLCGPVTSVAARLSSVGDLDIKGEDLANLLLELRSAACGSLQMDMLSPVYRRSFEIVCQRANYEWIYERSRLVRREAGHDDTIYDGGALERNDLFVSHMAHFLSRLGDSSILPRCSLDHGIAAMEVLLAAKRAANEARWVEVEQIA